MVNEAKEKLLEQQALADKLKERDMKLGEKEEEEEGS